MSDPQTKLRIDKWLWHARFFKTRTLAAKVVSAGNVRVNGTKTGKPSHSVAIEDVLTFPQANDIRVVRVKALGTRRGPASEAQQLYTDLSEPKEKVLRGPKYEGKGRPTKRDRRNLDLMKRPPLAD